MRGYEKTRPLGGERAVVALVGAKVETSTRLGTGRYPTGLGPRRQEDSA